MNNLPQAQRPTGAFIAASWTALLLGALVFIAGLWNAEAMPLYEKGFYFTLQVFGLFASVSLQKSVRDRLEGIPVTAIYYGLCWVALVLALVMLGIGLWNAQGMDSTAKGFYAMAFLLSLFGAVAVQKNTRDMIPFKAAEAQALGND